MGRQEGEFVTAPRDILHAGVDGTPAGRVQLNDAQVRYTLNVAQDRHRMGGKSRPLDSGLSAAEGDVMGVMAEMAVCLSRGYRYEVHVKALEERPKRDDLTDLTLGGVRIGVKGRARFDSPLDLVVPEYDTEQDVYVLCSVDICTGAVWIRGWVSGKELLRYEPEPWKWTKDRPGARRKGSMRRYVPVEALRPWKGRDEA